MARMASFDTDAAATTGFGADSLSLLTFLQEERGVAITDITQVAGAAINNDADWTIYVDGMATRYTWAAEELDPASVGRNRLLSPIRIHPRARIQLYWHGQAAAQANRVKIQYELI